MFRNDAFPPCPTSILQEKVTLAGAQGNFSFWKVWVFPSFCWKQSTGRVSRQLEVFASDSKA